jgi:hypothetical protein
VPEPFWNLQNSAEATFIDQIIRRRFPETYAVLETCLEEADPFDIVYAGNPGEYADVVRELLVLMAPVNGELKQLTRDQLGQLIREGLARCFESEPDESRVSHLVDLLESRSRP